jgi:hypothetical protein
MKTSTAGVYGAGIENRKRKVKFEIQNSKSERNPNSENRIHDWGTTFGIRISGFSRRATFLTPVWLAKKSAPSFPFTWRRV